MSGVPGHGAAKAWRYLWLYGPARTLGKIRARRALAGEGAAPVDRTPRPGQHVGMIGCGNFAFATIAHYLPRGSICGAMDIVPGRAAALARAHGAAYSTGDAARLLADPAITLVYIASNHASHADYAARALAAGKSVHIEKPHATDMAGLDAICAAMANNPRGAVGLGFNRPLSPQGRRVAVALAADSGPTMLNWFIAGHAIADDHWYNAPGEGGRVLGNLCHWIDMSRALIAPEQRYPIMVTPLPCAPDSGNLGVALGFGDGSQAMIAFSAKAEPFEGVRERLHAHRGATLIDLVDFHRLTVTRGAHTRTWAPLWRDHGHRAAILASYTAAQTGAGLPIAEVRQRGELILAAARAVETGLVQTVRA